jgi:hypothetical protein
MFQTLTLFIIVSFEVLRIFTDYKDMGKQSNITTHTHIEMRESYYAYFYEYIQHAHLRIMLEPYKILRCMRSISPLRGADYEYRSEIL